MLKPFEEGYCLTNKIHCAKHDRSAQFQNFQFQITEHRTENIDFLLNAKKKKQKKKMDEFIKTALINILS